jgi:splicing factor 3A subunit 3
LTGRKHVKAAEQRKQRQQDTAAEPGNSKSTGLSPTRLKEKAIAEREHRVKKLAGSMSTERSDTRVNVERKQGMTKREREQELENLLNASDAPREAAEDGEGEDDDDEDKIYNPLKVPLGWDGKPIPFWLYRLHGLGVEFPCEICGNYVYKGRRAFEKHFNEARHIYNLKCLGITNPTLFRDITKMDEAIKLWEKIQKEKKQAKLDEGSVVQMEDGEGNVMPEKVYYDLQKQGLL